MARVIAFVAVVTTFPCASSMPLAPSERDRHTGRCIRRLHCERELRRRPGGHVERNAGCTRQDPSRAGRQRVARPHLVDAEGRERGYSGHSVHRCRPSQRSAAGVRPYGHGDRALSEAVTVLPLCPRWSPGPAGVIAAPAATLLGCTVKTSFAAPLALIVNALLVAAVRAPEVALSV